MEPPHGPPRAIVRQSGVSEEFHLVGPSDEAILADIFSEIDDTYIRPHPFTPEAARELARRDGPDVYAVLLDEGRAVAYGMLRGWDEGYHLPTLGIAVRTSLHGRGLGRRMMHLLQDAARERGCPVLRLRVHAENTRARRLYESLGYVYAGVDRGELLMLLDLLDPDPAARTVGGSRTLDGRLVEAHAPEWAEVLERTPHDFYHLPGYVALCAAHEGGRACALYVAEGKRALLLPLIVRDIDAEAIDATSPYGYPGPLMPADDESFARLALAAARQVLQEAGVVTAFIRLHPLLNPPLPSGFGLIVQHGDTVSIDLTMSAGDLWGQFRKNHRRDISRATRLGFAARMDETWEHFETFKRLYRSTMERRGATAFYSFDDAYFTSLRETLGDRLHLCVVERDGLVAAAGMFVETGGIVEYHLAGSDDGLLQLQPLKLMLHYVTGWAKDRGDRVIHLGGGLGATSDSLLHFKRGFSPRCHAFSTLRMVLDWGAYRRLVQEHDPGLDPMDRQGFFPLYRM